MNFEVVIIGSDINAYYMARCTHEQYNKKAYLVAKEPQNFTSLSDILNIEYHPDLLDKEVFCSALENLALKLKDKKLILIPSNDFYVKLISENKEFLSQYYLFHSNTKELLSNLMIKDNFYTIYKDVLDVPNTYIFDCSKEESLKKDIIDTFMYPIIIKPSDGYMYYQNKFPGQSKVYKVNSFDEISNVVTAITNSGYTGKLIIQEFIPGGDDQLFDSILFCDKNKKVKLVSFAQIGLQERTHTGIGNCTVLVNGYSEHGNYDDQIIKMKNFLENVGYEGFCEFDLKYDVRDNKYKVFEINPRQARSSYYVSAAGYNLVKYIVDDLLYNKEYEYTVIKDKIALSFVPMMIIKKYITNEKLKTEIITLKKQGKLVDPLDYDKETSIKRKLWLFVRKFNYLRKYKNSTW